MTSRILNMRSSSNSHHQESLYFLLRAIPHPKPSFATSASILGCWWEQDSRYDRLDSIGESVLVQGTNHIRLQTWQLKKGEELQSHLPVFFTGTLNGEFKHGLNAWHLGLYIMSSINALKKQKSWDLNQKQDWSYKKNELQYKVPVPLGRFWGFHLTVKLLAVIGVIKTVGGLHITRPCWIDGRCVMYRTFCKHQH